jgi:hypothetical protein
MKPILFSNVLVHQKERKAMLYIAFRNTLDTPLRNQK